MVADSVPVMVPVTVLATSVIEPEVTVTVAPSKLSVPVTVAVQLLAST